MDKYTLQGDIQDELAELEGLISDPQRFFERKPIVERMLARLSRVDVNLARPLGRQFEELRRRAAAESSRRGGKSMRRRAVRTARRGRSVKARPFADEARRVGKARRAVLSAIDDLEAVLKSAGLNTAYLPGRGISEDIIALHGIAHRLNNSASHLLSIDESETQHYVGR